ncbi:MAG: pyridoxal 5'-phosphate synthase glutaminase subunit PdxT [Actinobacteria bacterium]|nr:pyridoxal 5'-phosphate synthase glutaminase subunit PdxT [Actinomycetota bacterium]
MESDLKNLKIGVLALQGAFREHIIAIKGCGALAYEVRLPYELEDKDGLIIPGGESTTISKLIELYEFKPRLDNFYRKGKPIFGTCAGLILLARRVKNENFGLGYIDIEVERNAYGRQIDSFEEFIDLNLNHNSDPKKFRAIFIRAPKITKVGDNVKVLGKIGNNVVMAREKNVLVSSFHPELSEDRRIHQYFLNMIREYVKKEN